MLRSLYSGISGLRAHQAMMDVTGNNIANVNTTGFKSSATQFEDTLSQLVSSAGRSQAGVGGTNPAQVGLGVRVAGTSTSFTQGSAQLTGKSTDMMINGDGFFVVKAGGVQSYTRNGSFGFDGLGQLTNPDGGILQGWTPDAAGNINTNGPVANMSIPTGTLIPPKVTSVVKLGGNLANNAPLNTATAPATTTNSTVGPISQIVNDATGAPISLQITFTHDATDSTKWTVSYTRPGSATAVSGANAITFDSNGIPSNTSGTPVSFSAQTASGTSPAIPAFKLDLSGLTGYSGPVASAASGSSTVTSTVKFTDQDGAAAGTLNAFALGADGTITATFDNGLKKIIGQVAMANFANPAGLTKSGGSLYQSTVNSGNPEVGAGTTGGRGSLASGSLEMSNVDLSQEFTNLIVAQRGFQANSRIITTSDQILQTLTQMGQ